MYNDLVQFIFVNFRCDCTFLQIKNSSDLIEILTFDNECKVNTKIWQMLSFGFENLQELRIPSIPSGFIPLLIKDKSHLDTIEVGEISNFLTNIICTRSQHTLKSFTFDGGQITYSGIISLFLCQGTLRELRIINPKYITKYSLAVLSRHLLNLR